MAEGRVRNRSPITSAPTEIVLDIFCALTSFEDVFSLAATCQRFQTIWKRRADGIYRSVATRSILCDEHARDFYQVSTGAQDVYMTKDSVILIVRNAKHVEKTMGRFEAHTLLSGRIPGCNKRPLTRGERRRFTRAYYQLRSLMTLQPEQWQSRIPSISLKHLYVLVEMCRLPQKLDSNEYIGPEPEPYPDTFSYEHHGKRELLFEILKEQVREIQSRRNDTDPESELYGIYDFRFLSLMRDESWVVIWSHVQDTLWKFCHIDESHGETETEYTSQYLWDDSSDEED